MSDLNLSLDDLDNLSEEERKLLADMVNELSTTGSSDTLKSLWYEDYEEIPVDIDTFIDDPRFLGGSLGNTIYPFWRDVLRKIFAPGARYYEIILSGAIGIGKSTIADVGLAYLLYKLLCMKNPQSYYGLTKSSIMTVNFFNISLTLAYSVAFSKFQQMLLNSPWFLEHGTVVGVKNQTYIPSKGIQLVVGSSEEHALGQDVFCCDYDTLIITDKGIHKIGELENKQVRVLQYDESLGFKFSDPCMVVLTKYVDELVQLTLDDGTKLRFTPDHRLMLKDGSYKMVKDLTENDELMSFDRTSKN